MLADVDGIREQVVAAHGNDVHAEVERGPRYNQSSLVIESAVLGRGVALAKSTLAAADIQAGRLVRPIAAESPVDFAYYFVAPRAKLNLPKVSYFHDWLRREAGEQGAN